MGKIKIAIVGVGNCTSSLIQGIEFYKNKSEKNATGLMHWKLGGYMPSDIQVVAAFDISRTKINKDISEAIYAEPNCCQLIVKPEHMPKTGASCYPGPISDGCYRSENGHLSTFDYFKAYDESKIY